MKLQTSPNNYIEYKLRSPTKGLGFKIGKLYLSLRATTQRKPVVLNLGLLSLRRILASDI